MIRKLSIAFGVSVLGLALAGPASADSMVQATAIDSDLTGYAQGVLEDGRTFLSPREKEGPARMAERQNARRELRELVDRAESGQQVDPGQVDALIRKVQRLQR